MMKKLLFALVASASMSSPALAKLDETSPIKTTRIIAMDQAKLQDCVTLAWGAPLLTTHYGTNSTRYGIAFQGTTLSVLIVTPVAEGIKVERQGSRVGEGLLTKCAPLA